MGAEGESADLARISQAKGQRKLTPFWELFGMPVFDEAYCFYLFGRTPIQTAFFILNKENIHGTNHQNQ